jgi:heme-degrading monooxygenase HmoA
MITIGMNYEVLEGKEEIFEKAFSRVLGALKDAEGHQTSRLLCDVHARRNYVIMSEWVSEEGFNNFISSPQFTRVVDWGKEQILAARPRHVVYRGDE